jgi:hypothetical protein
MVMAAPARHDRKVVPGARSSGMLIDPWGLSCPPLTKALARSASCTMSVLSVQVSVEACQKPRR